MTDKADFSILIVDDSLVMRKLLSSTLKNAGFNNLIEACDALSAFKVLKSHPVNLVLTDWIMPGPTGIELLEKVRKTPGIEDIAFIVVSSEALTLSKEKAGNLGISGYINKPFEDQDVISAVNKIYVP